MNTPNYNQDDAIIIYDIITWLHHKGYAVVIWTPKELGEVEVDDIEDAMIRCGHDVILYNKDI